VWSVTRRPCARIPRFSAKTRDAFGPGLTAVLPNVEMLAANMVYYYLKGRCFISNSKKAATIPDRTLTKLRAVIKESPWKTATSARYKDAPHSYIIFFNGKTVWKWFAGRIRKHGVYRTWKGYKYKYLLVDGEAFWLDWPALNKAAADTLDRQ
jgi:hypothetical protein